MNHKKSTEYCKAFGAHVRKLRLDQNLGMREFALIADMEYSQLSKIERGVTNPTLTTVHSLAEALGVHHAEMFSFKFPQKSKKGK